MHVAEIVLGIFGLASAVHGWFKASRAREAQLAARAGALMELFWGFGLLALVGADVLGGTALATRFWPWITAAILVGIAGVGTVGIVQASGRRKALQQSEGQRLVERLKSDDGPQTPA